MPSRKGIRARHRDRDAKLKLQEGLLFVHPKESELQEQCLLIFQSSQGGTNLTELNKIKKVLYKLFPLGSIGAFPKYAPIQNSFQSSS